jgi:hypothetical protein
MSCDPFEISPNGRRGIGVAQPQSGLDYPFVNLATADGIRYLLADFYLAYDDPGFYRANVPTAQHPLRIKWLYGVGCEPAAAPGWAPEPAHAADILIVDANDNIVFDSTELVPESGDETYQSFSKRAWGDDYDIYEWLGNNGVCRIVVYKTWPASFEAAPQNYPIHFAPTNAVLDERAVFKLPKRLKSLRVISGGSLLGSVRRRGAVFAAGNNMQLVSVRSIATRNTTTVTMNADAGAGTGRYSDCTDIPPNTLTTLNGVAPNQYGDLLISGPDCIWVRQATSIVSGRAVPVANALMFGSDCGPCCDCSDYVDTGLYMNRIRDRYKLIGARAHEVKIVHEANIARWLEQRDCRLQKPLRIILVPQNCPTMDVVLMYCNQCQQCASDVVVSVTFSTFPSGGTAEVMCGYTSLYAPGIPGRNLAIDGTWPTFSARFPPIDVGNSAYVKFRLKFSPFTTPFTVTGTVTGTIDGNAVKAGCEETALAASAIDVQTLNCDETGATVRPC